MQRTQITLLDRIRKGDEESWRELDGLYRPLIFGWLQQLGFESNDIDDLTQDVLLTLSREIGTFEHRGHLGAFRGWLKTITVNRAREVLRRSTRRPAAKGGTSFHVMLEQLEDTNSELSRQFDRSHDAYIIGRMLDRISPEFSSNWIQAFQMHVVDGRDAQEVADELGVTRWTVYQAKSRMLRRLRETLGDWTSEMGLE